MHVGDHLNTTGVAAGEAQIYCLTSGSLNRRVNSLRDERTAPQTANYRYRMRLSGRAVGVCVWVDEEMPRGKAFFYPPAPPHQIQRVVEEICFFLERGLTSSFLFCELPLIAILQPATGGRTEVFLITLSGEARLALTSF